MSVKNKIITAVILFVFGVLVALFHALFRRRKFSTPHKREYQVKNKDGVVFKHITYEECPEEEIEECPDETHFEDSGDYD